MAVRQLRTVFFGSSAFSVPALMQVLAAHEVVAVVTQPPKPAGRGLKLTPTPVALTAQEEGAVVITPARLDAAFIELVQRLQPELLAVASYGKILPAALLSVPGSAALNVHPSLLPLYRGATPIQSALRDGCGQTGVTIFWMTPRMDAGDIALARTLAIESSDDYGTLHDKLAQAGGELLAEAATRLSEDRLGRTPQREEDATYCRPLTKDDRRLQLNESARHVVNQIRSLSPKPGAWMIFEGKRLKVLKAQAVDEQVTRAGSASASEPGTILGLNAGGPVIACASGAIRLLRVVPEGRSVMSGAQFARDN